MKSILAMMLLAAAAPAGGKRAAIVNPDWQERPGAEQISRLYPLLPQKLWIGGRVVLSCVVNDLGALEDCKAADATPSGLGFETAGLTMARYFRMKPMTRNGVAVAGGTVRIPLAFKPAPGPARPPEPAPASATAVRLAERYVEASRSLDGFFRSYDRIADDLASGRGEDAAALDPAARAQVAVAFRTALDANRPRIRSELAKLIAARYSESELRGALDWAAIHTPGRQDEKIARAEAALAYEQGRLAHIEARRVFCQRRDCEVRADLGLAADMSGPKPAVGVPAPIWSRAPNAELVGKVRPFAARILRLPGLVRLNCRVGPEGLLSACAVAHESPAGIGFRGAALALASYFRLDASLISQGAAGETVAVTIPFASEGDGGPAEPALEPRSAQAQALARRFLTASADAETMRREFEAGLASYTDQPDTGLDPQLKTDLLAAMIAGGEAARQATLDRAAAILTWRYTDAELAAQVDFMQRPMAARLVGLDRDLRAPFVAWSNYWGWRIYKEAGAALCAARGCPADLAPAQPISDRPEASTRTP